MKWVFLIAGIISVSLVTVIDSISHIKHIADGDTYRILAAIFLSTYSILDRMDKKNGV